MFRPADKRAHPGGTVMCSAIRAALSASVIVLAAATPAFASADAEEVMDGAVIRYQPGFFTPFNPVTALDMVRRVPGFQIEAVEQQRGLAGGFGNVLVNGARPAGKADVERLLRRIPVGDVERIELIRESVPGVDLQGAPRVVNVVTRRAAGVSGAWRARATSVPGGRVTPSGEVSATFPALGGELTLGLDARDAPQRRIEDETRFTPDGDFLRVETSTGRNIFQEVSPSTRFVRRFEGGHALEIDARGVFQESGFERLRVRTGPSGAPESYQINIGAETSSSLEVSADYMRVLGEALTLSLTGVQRLSHEDEDETIDEFDALAAPEDAFLVLDATDDGESILRAQLDWDASDAHAFEFALEGAFNFLDGAFQLFEGFGDDRAEIEVPGGAARVEERRADASAQHVWRPADSLTLETRLAIETSEISQTGDASRTRRFTFTKPYASAAWTPDDRTQWRLTAQREVGQLDFNDFVSSVSLRDDQTSFGNPELEPERAWILEGVFERRYAERGSLRLSLAQEWIEAVEGVVPFNGEDAPGNLGDATLLRFDFEADLPLDSVGLPGALLSPSLTLVDSSVTDPVTGEDRPLRFREDWAARIDFRQDLPQLGVSWGVDWNAQADTISYRLDQFERYTGPRGAVDVFVETTRIPGVTARFGADLQLDEDSERVRERYDPDRTGEIVRRDIRIREEPRRVYLEVSGVF